MSHCYGNHDSSSIGGGGQVVDGSAYVSGVAAGCQFDRNAGRETHSGSYTVRASDSMDFIACDFNIALTCLEASNPQIALRGKIFVGDVLTIDRSCPPWEGPILAEKRENG